MLNIRQAEPKIYKFSDLPDTKTFVKGKELFMKIKPVTVHSPTIRTCEFPNAFLFSKGVLVLIGVDEVVIPVDAKLTYTIKEYQDE